MEVRDLEDMLVSLFDPQLTLSEKTELLRGEGGRVRYAWCLSDSGGVVPIDGIEVVFTDGTAFRLVIISASGR
jgi:hypothetical protein